MAGLLSIITVQLLAAIGTAAGASSQHCEKGVSNPSCDVGEENTGFIQLKGRQVLMESRNSDVYVIDVKTKYGEITASTVNNAMKEAKQILGNGTSVQIDFAEGTHIITTEKSDTKTAFIDLSGINWDQPSGTQQLILSGAGKYATTFLMDGNQPNIYGQDTSRVTIQHMTWKRTSSSQFATQGTIQRVMNGKIMVKISKDYPPPNNNAAQGKYIKRYEMVTANGETSCDIIKSNNDQITWTVAANVSFAKRIRERTYKFSVRSTSGLKKGDLIGIKSKSGDGQPYQFNGASDITFISNRWFTRSRGNFRGTVVKNIAFIDCEIAREKTTDCLATTGGGPQIGHGNDPSPENITIRNFVAYNTGDDSVALFNVNGGVLDNVTIYSSFARGINLNNVNDVTVMNSQTNACDLACQAPYTKLDTKIGSQGICVSMKRKKCFASKASCGVASSLAQSLES